VIVNSFLQPFLEKQSHILFQIVFQYYLLNFGLIGKEIKYTLREYQNNNEGVIKEEKEKFIKEVTQLLKDVLGRVLIQRQ